jgi:hypothetical protein
MTQKQEDNLDALFSGAFPADHPAMLDYVALKFELRRLRAVAAASYKWNCQIAQLLDGWHADGTCWSKWDEEVRQGVTEIGRTLEPLRGELNATTKGGAPTPQAGETSGGADREASSSH